MAELARCITMDADVFSFEKNQVALSMDITIDGNELSYFSIISQLGAIQDVAVSEFKIELMFPADEETKNYYTEH